MGCAGISIRSNIYSLRAQRVLSLATEQLGDIQNRLSSGTRINRASDDPAGLSVSASLTAAARIYSQGIRNINDGLSLLNIAQGGLEALSSITMRQQELAMQASNGTLSAQQRASLHAEATALVSEYNRIVQTTEFNGTALFDGSASNLRIQAGFGLDGGVAFGLGCELSRIVGDGTFQAPVSYSAGTNATALVIEDLSHDGNVDLGVVVNTGGLGTNFLQIMLGNGDSTFTAALSYEIPDDRGNIVFDSDSADFNGDGNLDYAAAHFKIPIWPINGQPGYLTVMFGNSDGSFGSNTTIDTTFSTRSIIADDLNGDGKSDIIVGGDGSNLFAYLGNGDGSFRAKTLLSTPAMPYTISVADINGDGKSDVITSDPNTSLIYTFIGNGNGTFLARRSWNGGDGSRAVSVNDVNSDGLADIITAPNSTETLNVLVGNGDGSFRKGNIYPTGISASSFAVADFNGDGLFDCMGADSTSAAAVLLLGNGDGSFSEARSFNSGGNGADFRANDLNNDGVLDGVIVTGTVANILVANTTATASTPFLDLHSREGALSALAVLDKTIDRVSRELGAIGAFQSRLSAALANLSCAAENYTTAESRIRDTDVTSETASLVRTQILENAASAVLGQANQAPALALKLLSSL